MCEIHLLFANALITVMFFRFAFLKSVGAKYFGACPLSQFECQKLALYPLPTVTSVEALKRSLSILSQGISSPVHGLSWCCHLNYNQCNHSARAKRSRSRMPNPPSFLGVQVVGQLTRQCPPLTFSGSSPFHRKLLRILSICRSNHFCIGKTVRW
jgi:hypothetical protein